MNLLEIKNKLKDFIIFTQKDIRSIDSLFCRQNLNEWQKKNYIKKIIKGFYTFSDRTISTNELFTIANKIFQPSYVSFESALSYYNLIPEAIYGITSASSKNTYKFKSYAGDFIYRKIKPALLFGYKLVKYSKTSTFQIADIEKAILDYFYIKPHLKSEGDFEELRINSEDFFEQVDKKKLKKYLSAFNNKQLTRRLNKFLRYMEKVKNA